MTENTKPTALTVNNLTVSYGRVAVLWDVSIAIPTGHVVGIIGPNGAGKTTLIKSCLGLIKPLSGQVQFLGQSLSSVRNKIAYIPQKEAVDWDFPITVKDLVLMGRYGKLGLFKRPKQADYKAVDQYLDMVGMREFADRQINELSGGQQQRAFLARALIQEADIYLMDEPFVGVDLTTRSLIVEVLHQLKKKGKTVFVVHHELDHVKSYFDWVIMLNTRLVAQGPTELVFNQKMLSATYGKNYAIIDQVLRLSEQKAKGG